ncbi:MAG TPA: hypothetical protein VF553_12630 [Pyrinomonadaceae bacterium]|jgi:hypothetical protein
MCAGNIMGQLRLVLGALLVLSCAFNTAAQGEFPSVDAFLKATLKGEDRLSAEARGELNGDGLEDWAGVIQRQKSESTATTQLYVLLRTGQGGYRVAEKSKEEQIAGMGCCWVENLEINRSSIYIQNNAKTASTMEAATHQFKLYKGEWRLVGLRIYYTDLSSDASTETDMNLLTGSVIEKRQQGENRPVTRNRRKRFSTYLLKDFDFSNGFGSE